MVNVLGGSFGVPNTREASTSRSEQVVRYVEENQSYHTVRLTASFSKSSKLVALQISILSRAVKVCLVPVHQPCTSWNRHTNSDLDMQTPGLDMRACGRELY